jgi:hypothetical protein
MDADLLHDEWELRQLSYRYARACDSNEPETLDAIFTADAEIESDLFTQRGIAEIRAIPAMLRQMFAKTMHAVHNQTVTVIRDTAHGETYGIAYQINHAKDGKQTSLDWGVRYQDKFARVDGVWRFTRRRLIVDWTRLVEVRPLKGP